MQAICPAIWLVDVSYWSFLLSYVINSDTTQQKMMCHQSSKLGDFPYGIHLVLIFLYKAIKISCGFWRNPLSFIRNLGPFHKIRPPLSIGKSNLMDAISFVFGERTQSLRVRTVKVSVLLLSECVCCQLCPAYIWDNNKIAYVNHSSCWAQSKEALDMYLPKCLMTK